MEEVSQYAVIIIGTGPAGLAAAIYAARYGVKNAVFGELSGGQAAEAHLIDNYPGVEDISGAELTKKMTKHAEKYGADFFLSKVISVEKDPGGFTVKTAAGKTTKGKTIIFATGTQRRKLNVKNEEKFYGKGVSYCATCDGFFQKGKVVAVVGGSDSAAGAATYLSGIAEKVYLIYRKKELRCEKYWKNALNKAKNIEVLLETNILEILGKEKVEGLKIKTLAIKEQDINVNGIFIEVGSDPETKLAREMGVEIDEEGYIKTKENGATSVTGVWAAGDATDGSDKLKQIITAAAEGAIAARSVFKYLKKRGV